MNRRLVPGLPFALSMILSLSTVGSHLYWQDSGFYLTAVRKMGVLYPHGFVVYQLLCKAWTLLLFFVDFTLAVHLFSALCTALAAATIALAARDFLEEGRGEVPAALTGCLAAAGYTFWFSGIYAKVYALLYFALALLMWAVVRSVKSPSRVGVFGVAALAGLAWTIHPSVALGGLGLAAYFAFMAKKVGVRPVLGALGVGLAVALAPGLLLPVLSARDVETSMGSPRTAGQVLHYLLGSRFTGISGVFGLEQSRISAMARFFWEEYLGVGVLLIAAGGLTLAKRRPRVLAAGLCWIVPYALVALLFKIEGQSDHWGVAAGLPLSLGIASGLARLGEIVRRPRAVQIGAATVALAWAVAANGADLNLRGYDLAETYGKLYLQNLEPDAVLFARTDDVLAAAWGLQALRNYRRDIVVVDAAQLGAEEIWYDRCLQRHHPDLRLPTSLPDTRGRSLRESDPFVAAYLAANVGGRRPLYVTEALVPDLLPPGQVLVPQGVLWRLLPVSEDRVHPEHWNFPLEPEVLPKLFRRARGLSVTMGPDGFECETEPYERRLQRAILKARTNLADWEFRHGQTATALPLYQSVLRLDPHAGRNESFVHSMALCSLAQGKPGEAAMLFRRVLEIGTRPWLRASSLLALGDIARAGGDAQGARRSYEEASRVLGLTPVQEAEVRKRLGGP